MLLCISIAIKNEQFVRPAALHINEFPLKCKLYDFHVSDCSDGDILGRDTIPVVELPVFRKSIL